MYKGRNRGFTPLEIPKHSERKAKFLTGFTLVETVVTITVLSVLAFSTMYIMVEGMRVWWENKNFIELRSEGRYALRRLSVEFKQAETVTLDSPTNITFTSDYDNDGTAQRIRYHLSGANLMRNEQGVGDAVICGNVVSLNFSWDSPLLIVNLTLSKQADQVKLRTKIASRCIPL